MDGAIHTAAAEQAVIGRVDDGIDFQRCDIGVDRGQSAGHVACPFEPKRFGVEENRSSIMKRADGGIQVSEGDCQ